MARTLFRIADYCGKKNTDTSATSLSTMKEKELGRDQKSESRL